MNHTIDIFEAHVKHLLELILDIISLAPNDITKANRVEFVPNTRIEMTKRRSILDLLLLHHRIGVDHWQSLQLASFGRFEPPYTKFHHNALDGHIVRCVLFIV